MFIINHSLRSLVRATAFGVLLGSAAITAPASFAQETQITISPNAYGATRRVEIEINKTLLLDLPAGAAEVVVSQPSIAAAIMRTQTRAIIQGVTGGDTNVFFIDSQGRTIAVLEVQVIEEPSQVGNALQGALARAIPGSKINVESVTLGNDIEVNRVVLTGTVLSGEDRERATAIAVQFAGAPDNVANILDVAGTQQVMLQVTVSEVKRDIAKQFGINLGGVFNVGTSNVLNIVNNMIDGEIPHGVDGSFAVGSNTIQAGIRALERRGGLRVLAQPTLTAISGQEAKFLAGGELPYYSFDEDDEGQRTRTVLFKPYGVELAFTPTVKSNGLIALQVRTSVSEPQADQSLSRREASTSVELPGGTTLAIGGLLEEKSTQQIEQFPWLGDIPILGALFRSRDFQTEQTELVILVTPFLVAPSPLNGIAVPTDASRVPTDAESIFLGKVESLYGVGTTGEMRGSISGSVGFVLD